MQAIINTKLILEDSYVWDGAVTNLKTDASCSAESVRR